jgi:hypothetical protein
VLIVAFGTFFLYMGGTRQEGKIPKNWDFYPLHIGFS